MEQAMMDNVMTRQQAVSMVLDLYGRIDELDAALDDMAGRLADAERNAAGEHPGDGGLSERVAKVLPALLWDKACPYGRGVRVMDNDDGTFQVEDFGAWLSHSISKDYVPDGLSLDDAKKILHDYAMTVYRENRESALADARARHDAEGGGEDE